MKRGEDDRDAGEVRVALPAMRRWWRSVGFWLGLWGLAFLVWGWVATFSKNAMVLSHGYVSVANFPANTTDSYVLVSEGRVMVVLMGVHEAPPSAKRFKAPLRFSFGRKMVRTSNFGRPTEFSKEDPAWGRRSTVDEVMLLPEKLSLKTREWWFPFGFVVAGYVVVWVGLMILWRWWMRRRWRAAQVVEG